MKQNHDSIKKKIEDLNYEIKRLQELHSLASNIRMKNNIQARIHTLNKELFVLEILNF
jgi:hypothetical protein